MPVLIDNCVVLFVKVHALFVLNGEIDINNLKQQKHYLYESQRSIYLRSFIRSFILCDIILSLKVCFDRMAVGLLTVDDLGL